MLDIGLQSDEILIVNTELGWLNSKAGELFLTNKRLVWAKKATFGNKIKELKELPLSSIKMHNGEPQVKTDGSILDPKIQIQHTNGIDTIGISGSRRNAMLWLNEIHKAMTGHEASSDADKAGNMSIPGMDILGKGLKDSVGAFASGLGLKDALSKKKRISVKCSTCGAPLTGNKGDSVTCEYCGTTQVLK